MRLLRLDIMWYGCPYADSVREYLLFCWQKNVPSNGDFTLVLKYGLKWL